MKNVYKVIAVSVVVIAVIVGTVLVATNTLKQEAIASHLELSKLHTNIFAEQVSQTLYSLEETVDNLGFVLQSNQKEKLNQKFETILATNAYIRSLNILDANHKIIHSSNQKNIGFEVDSSQYYPIPMFDKTILRFGKLQQRRDISLEDEKLYYLPVSKMIKVAENEYTIIIAINFDQLTNRYGESIFSALDIARIDGEILYSTTQDKKIATIDITPLYEEAIEKTTSLGVEILNDISYLSSYQLTQTYPLVICIKSEYDKTLYGWEQKRFYVLIILASLVSVFIALAFALAFKHDHSRKKELRYQKEKLENKKKFEIIFEQHNFLASILESDGTVQQINHIFLDFLKEENETIVGKKIYELSCWEKEDKEWIFETIKNYIKGSSLKKELMAKDKNNTIHFIELVITSVAYEDNINLVVIGTDITEDKIKEEKLQNAYTVFNNTNDGIVITDKDAKIIDINKAFTFNTGYTSKEIIGQNPKILQSNKHNLDFYKKMWEDINNKNFWHGEIINKRKDGKLYTELLTINRIFDKGKKVKNYIGVFTNISKQKEQEQLLKEKENMLFQQSKMASMGEMLENIAHQWRQPLSVISTAASGVKIQKEFNILEDHFMDESLELIVSSTQHLSKTIDDFRNFFRQDKEKVEFLLANAIEKSLQIVSSKFDNRGITVEKNFTGITVFGFENELVQVIMNILNNARDALEHITQEDVRFILIETFIEDTNAILVVTDTAGGIQEELLEKIFEPYFTTKHQTQGTGIGLYMSQEIISKHMNGALSVQNKTFKHKGQVYTGASFKITLPRDEEQN